ncbi:MAG: hypothetical protein ACYCZ0_03950 [Minisyncoccota bacterium]
MSFARTHSPLLILGLVFAFIVALPIFASAVGQAPCICQLQDPKKPLYCPTVTCIDVTNGFPTTGFCVAPGICKGTATGGKDGFGLDKVAQILGDLMGKLMGQKGGDTPQPPPPPGGDTASKIPPTCTLTSSTVSSNASSTTATLSWSSSYEATSASITPNIGTVSVNGSQSITITETTPYSMSVTGPGGTGYCSAIVVGFGDGGTDKCSGIFADIYGCEDDGGDDDIPGPGTSSSTPNLSASPTSGTAPLTVVFTGNAGSAGYTIKYGDGKTNAVGCEHGSCSPTASPLSINRSHVYEEPGTYTAKLLKHFTSVQSNCTGEDCNAVDSVTIRVTAQTTSGTTNTTGSTTVPVFSNPAYLLPGLRGDIKMITSGGTVVVGARSQNNTEVAGFYGGTTFSGPATGVVATLCRTRPWAGNFLSYILPANFFDGLCVSRGYTVGAPAAQQTSGTTQTSGTSQAAPKPAQKPATSTPAVSNVPPKVRVWAVPSTVPLGSRASVFWTSQGVVSCLVASPDGSFSQTTLSGGASTVSLTGPTTFTISCLTADGTPITDFVTINLAI